MISYINSGRNLDNNNRNKKKPVMGPIRRKVKGRQQGEQRINKFLPKTCINYVKVLRMNRDSIQVICQRHPASTCKTNKDYKV